MSNSPYFKTKTAKSTNRKAHSWYLRDIIIKNSVLIVILYLFIVLLAGGEGQ